LKGDESDDMDAPLAETFMKTLLSTDEASAVTGLSTSTLAKWRSMGKGPAHIRLSRRRVAYEAQVLQAWIESRRRQSTADYDDEDR
jgi:predicted DNA-binding transcriptional regulator AlpA